VPRTVNINENVDVQTPRGTLAVPEWAQAMMGSEVAAAPSPAPDAPRAFDLVGPDGKRYRLTAPPGTSDVEIMQRAAALATSPESIGATPEPGMVGRAQAAAGAGARPLTPGGEPVSPASLAVQAATDPEFLLGAAGELAGAASPVPGGALGGAALGGAAGRAVKRVVAGQPVLGEGGAAELATAAGTAGAGAAVGRAGAALSIGVPTALATGATRETAEAAAARAFLEPRLRKTGINLALTPAESSDSALLDLTQNIAEGGFFSRGRMQRYFASRREGLKQVADDFLNEIAPNLEPSAIADVFVAGVQGRNAAAMLTSTGLRKQFEDRAGHIIAQTGKLRAIAKSIVEGSERRGHVGAAREGVPLAERVLDIPQTTTVSDLAELRSSLLEQKRGTQLGERVPKGMLRTINKLIHEVDQLIETNVKDPETIKLWRESNALVKERMATTDSAFLKRLVRISDPAKLGVRGGGAGADELVTRVFANENTAKATVRALGADSPEMKALQRRYVSRAFADATDQQGNISGAKLLDSLVGKGGQAEARFTAAFPDPVVRRNLVHFGDALRTIEKQAGEAGGGGTMLIQLTQGSALLAAVVTAAATGFIPAALGTIATTLISPSVFAEMLTRKPTARLLMMAVKTPPTAKIAGSLISRLAIAAKQIEEQNAIDEFLASVPAAGRGSVRTQEREPVIP